MIGVFTKFAPSKIRTCRLGLEIRSFIHLTNRGESVINNILPEDSEDSLICLECHCTAVFGIRKNDELVSWILVVQNSVDLVLRLKQRVRLRAAAPTGIHAVASIRNALVDLSPNHRVVSGNCHCQSPLRIGLTV